MLHVIRFAHVGEALSAMIACFFIFGLPFPPDSRHVPQWAYLAGVTIGAAFLAWRVGRPERWVWRAIVALAVFALGPLVIHFGSLTALFHPVAGVSSSVMAVLVALYALGQVVALLCAIAAIRREAMYHEPATPAT